MKDHFIAAATAKPIGTANTVRDKHPVKAGRVVSNFGAKLLSKAICVFVGRSHALLGINSSMI
jgi:hypothetical protein